MSCTSRNAVEVPGNKHGNVCAGCNLLQALQQSVHLDCKTTSSVTKGLGGGAQNKEGCGEGGAGKGGSRKEKVVKIYYM